MDVDKATNCEEFDATPIPYLCNKGISSTEVNTCNLFFAFFPQQPQPPPRIAFPAHLVSTRRNFTTRPFHLQKPSCIEFSASVGGNFPKGRRVEEAT